MGSHSTASKSRFSHPYRRSKQSLLEGIRAWKQLYYKVEHHSLRTAIGPVLGPGSYPQRRRTRWSLGDDGLVGAVDATKRNLLRYTEPRNGASSLNGCLHPVRPCSAHMDETPLADAFDDFWDALTSLDDEGAWAFKGQGVAQHEDKSNL